MIDRNMLYFYQRALLGAAVMHGALCVDAVLALGADAFADAEPATRRIYETLTQMRQAGEPISLLTVTATIGEEIEPELARCCEFAAAPDEVAFFGQKLRGASSLSMAQTAACELLAASSVQEATDILDRVRVSVGTGQQEPVLLKDILQAYFSAKAEQAKPEYLRWGMRELNEALFVERGDLVILGGYASAGKTLLSLQFALEMSKRYKVGYFSLETSAGKLTNRLLAAHSSVPLRHILTRELTPAEWQTLGHASAELSERGLELVCRRSMSVPEIRCVALSRGYDVIFVDYMQLIQAPPGTRYEQVTGISIGLHQLSQAHGITVIALAQLARPETVGKKPAPPTMHSFRESGQIEQDADVAMLLYPEDPYNNRSRRILSVCKNKEGEKLKLTLEFDGATQTMKPVKPPLREQLADLRRADREERRQQKDAQQTMFQETKDKDLPF